MKETAERIDSETAEKLIWALEALDGHTKGCLTCGEQSRARQYLIAATLTKEQIKELAECDRRARVRERSFNSEQAASDLFSNCVRSERFTEALREMAQE